MQTFQPDTLDPTTDVIPSGRRLTDFRAWVARHFTPDTSFMIMAFFTGLAAGLAAGLLKDGIGFMADCANRISVMAGAGRIALFVAPIIGIMATGAYMRYVLRRNIEHGSGHLVNNIAAGKVNLSPKLMIAPIVGASLTLGFGGSAGSEGPIAYAGSAIGSNIGRYMGLDSKRTALLLAIGAGAGIAGIFKSPVGGTFYALEVMGMQMGTAAVIALFVACLTASLTAYVASGCTVDLPFSGIEHFELNAIPAAMVLGVVCGLFSLFYRWQQRTTARHITAVSRPWLRNLIAGTSLGVLIFIFPSLYGEGYGAAGEVINGHPFGLLHGSLLPYHWGIWGLVAATACILAVKAAAVALTNSGGGIAGDFAPTLFAGAVLGCLFGTVGGMLPVGELPTHNLAYCAMAGAMAGIIRAPLMAIFLVVEMCAGYALLLPVTITALISYVIVKVLSPK